MNLYFLVEGRSTEKKVYPKFINHFIGSYHVIKNIEDASEEKPAGSLVGKQDFITTSNVVSEGIAPSLKFNSRYQFNFEI